MEPGLIIETYFGWGSDELVNRAFRAYARDVLVSDYVLSRILSHRNCHSSNST